MHADPPPELVGLYLRARLCRLFPSYRLEEIRGPVLLELLKAARLLDTVEQVHAKPG
jgi:hypothetical protein